MANPLLFLWVVVLLLQQLLLVECNRYFDKSVPDEETLLTEEDFRRMNSNSRRERREAAAVGEDGQQAINDSAMYSRERFEGDIVNPGLNVRTLKSTLEDSQALSKTPGLMRNAVRQPYLKWPNAKIPFTISKQYTTFGRDRIAEALDEYRTKTCVEFRPKMDADSDYVHILPDDGCYSLVGKVGGKQPVSLGDGCMSKGIIVHELMHSVGFFHEQSRADRDDYVNVIWANIESGLTDQFDKYSLNMIDYLGTNYDYGSVMHYGPLAFSKNGKPTIEPKQKGVAIGQRIGFSPIDLYKINKLYNCPQLGDSSGSSAGTATANGGPASSAAGDSSGSVSVSVRCADQRADCAYLASRGHCESIFSSAFMASNCAASCGHCGGAGPAKPESPPCDDQRDWCGRWASNGMCELYLFQQYMHSTCARSCALC